MAGGFLYYYSQLERSPGDGNYLQWGMGGLEYGLVWLFELRVWRYSAGF
jgi:hypothetical protein